ncbi:Craniofacial development protein 2, partial [Varanus komodoensis]
SFDHSAPSKRPHSTISNSSTSSSSSQSSSSILGSLNLHVYSTPSHPSLIGPPFYHWSYDVGTCIEEDELEQDTGSQPSMSKPFNITVVQVYVLTTDAEEAEVDQFYEGLQHLLELTPKNDVSIIMGDWNAKVGSQKITGITGRFGVQNEARQRLAEFCQENTLVIASTLFHQPKRLLYTWTSPDGQHRNQIDYVLCSQRWRAFGRVVEQQRQRLGESAEGGQGTGEGKERQGYTCPQCKLVTLLEEEPGEEETQRGSVGDMACEAPPDSLCFCVSMEMLYKVSSNPEILVAKFGLNLKKVGKSTKPLRYDLNHIPDEYTVEVTNRFKELDLIDRVPEELWMEVHNIIKECKDIEENNRMGKTRELFKKIEDMKRKCNAKMGMIKDQNGRDLTKAEEIKKRWQEYTEELYKKELNVPDNHDGVVR